MVSINDIIDINPPVVNSSCLWASELEQLVELYESPHVGAVTTRTSSSSGFEAREDRDRAVWFSQASSGLSTVNTYEYSPHPLRQYLQWVETILGDHPDDTKPIIISIAPSDHHDFRKMLEDIQQRRLANPSFGSRIAVEVNLSCPNIPGAPPPGYDISSFGSQLGEITESYRNDKTFTVGLKLPPYSIDEEYDALLKQLVKSAKGGLHAGENPRCPISFLSCTNTRGGGTITTLSGETRSGGLGGDAIHELSLANVKKFATLLSSIPMQSNGVDHIKIIGIGGVTSKAAVARMKQAGAAVVGCASLFGKEGAKAFEILASSS